MSKYVEERIAEIKMNKYTSKKENCSEETKIKRQNSRCYKLYTKEEMIEFLDTIKLE